jgi:hypothetical protein
LSNVPDLEAASCQAQSPFLKMVRPGGQRGKLEIIVHISISVSTTARTASWYVLLFFTDLETSIFLGFLASVCAFSLCSGVGWAVDEELFFFFSFVGSGKRAERNE